MTRPRLSMKREIRPVQPVEVDANITAFSDEYDLGERIPFSMQNTLF